MANADLRLNGKSPLVDPGPRTVITWGAAKAESIRIDDDPTAINSNPFFCSGWAGVWVDVFIDSTGAPTNLRLIARGAGAIGGDPNEWFDFLEGFWASLYWEDADTASGVRQRFNLPLGAWRALQFRLVGIGTGAQAYFDVAIHVTPYKPAVGIAHS